LPKKGDDDLLLQAGRSVEKLHVRYRVTSAFGQLVQSGMLRVDRVEAAEELLASYEEAADAPLRRRLDRTATALRAYARDPKG
jgi:hypothetical protein